MPKCILGRRLGNSQPSFRCGLANISKSRNLVVGTHGCHTSPECLEKLGPLPQVAIRRGAGTPLFHPKLYIFEHANHHTVVIGSHNLIKGAFESNVELSKLTEYSKHDPTALKLSAFILEERHPSLCVLYSPLFLKRYQDLYRLARKQRRDLDELVNDLPSLDSEKQRREAPIYMPWEQFYEKACHDRVGSLEERLKVLRYIRDLFTECPNFADMHTSDHLRIAGLATAEMCEIDGVDWNLFGHMKTGDAFGKPYGDLIRNHGTPSQKP
jgi:hypothetical protein